MTWGWTPATVEAIAGAVTALIVVWGALTAIHRTRRQRQREFEDVYLRRYWELLDRISLSTLRGHDPGNPVPEDDAKAIRLYFRLSEDEADLRQQGWMSAATWRDWSGAIRSQMQREPCRRLWEQALLDSDMQLDYRFTHLRRLCAPGGETYDPWTCRPGRWPALLRRIGNRRRSSPS